MLLHLFQLVLLCLKRFLNKPVPNESVDTDQVPTQSEITTCLIEKPQDVDS